MVNTTKTTTAPKMTNTAYLPDASPGAAVAQGAKASIVGAIIRTAAIVLIAGTVPTGGTALTTVTNQEAVHILAPGTTPATVQGAVLAAVLAAAPETALVAIQGTTPALQETVAAVADVIAEADRSDAMHHQADATMASAEDLAHKTTGRREKRNSAVRLPVLRALPRPSAPAAAH
ncbi:hypothetical protein FRC07_008280 [Ceratobasidium sp. 392]|nr:hypothetical protein FRC07_008280 [Ceratobasidium sp. 392]